MKWQILCTLLCDIIQLQFGTVVITTQIECLGQNICSGNECFENSSISLFLGLIFTSSRQNGIPL